MKKEKFVIRPVAGGFATVPDDPKACPLLERLWAGPVDEKVETTDTLAEFVAHIRSVAKGMGVVALVCGSHRSPTVILWEKRRAQRVPKPRRGWINNLADVATKLYEIEAEGLDERDDKQARELADAVSHRVYKYTSCGAWLALMHAGEWDPQTGHKPARHVDGSLVGVTVGSIVEGIDACTDTHDLAFPFTQKQFWEALQAVEDEAESLWNDTHGCETCARHWAEKGVTSGEWGPFEGNDGVTPVWKECPDCQGSGSVI